MSIKLFICLALLTTIAGQDHKDLIPKHEPNTFNELNGIEQQKDYVQNTTETEKSGRQLRIQVSTNSTTNLASNNDINKVNRTAENEEMVASSSQIMTSRPYSQYEVTENVIDVPNTRTPPGPIVPNYTVRPALNIAVPVILTEDNNTPESPNKEDNTESPNKEDNIQNKKNRFSILHVNAEFDDKPNDIHDNKVTGILRGIKEYLQNIHKGIYNGIHRFFHKHDETHGNRFKKHAEEEVVKVV